MKPYLSVVIPAYNEAENFRNGVLVPALVFLKKQKYSWEILFVNDGSTDNTEKLLQDFCLKNKKSSVITIAHGGKAAAVTAGILKADGEIILFTDFDQSTPIDQVSKIITAHKAGYDVAIGNRGMSKMDNKLFRKLRSWIFLTLVQIVLLPGIMDSQCGFKSFKNAAAKRIFSNLKVTKTSKVVGGYMGAFDVEALFLARKLGYKTAQIPVSWKKVEGKRLNPLTEPIKMLRDVFRVRVFDFLGKYNTV